MPFCLHYNIISNTFLIINLLNQQVSVPHPVAGGSTFNLHVEWRKSVENFRRYSAMNATHLAKNEIGETVT